jgi:soluble cytochrome b562
MRYTPKQIEKYRRQKYIATIEKISKNLFRMFRNRDTNAESFRKKLDELVEKLDSLEKTRLESGYLNESEKYIRSIYSICTEEKFCDSILDEMREEEMSKLNRLQKMKNRNSYKKEKYMGALRRDGWE